MGGSSKSESKQQTTQTDNRIGAADSAQVAASGGRITNRSSTSLRVESVDPEVAQAALSEAFSFGRRALKTTDQTTAAALDFGGDTVGQALELTERALVGAQGAYSQGLEQQRALVETTVARGSEDLQGLKGLLSTTAIVAIGAFALIGLRR